MTKSLEKVLATEPRHSVEILLATCNGAQYLAAQLDSLLGQTCRSFTVLVSDDGSTDGTRAIVDRYAEAHPGFLRLLDPLPQRLGASENFGRLLDAAEADYVLFCDQDDVWLPDKLELSLARMRLAEAAHPQGFPILVHTDLKVVDENLRILEPSFVRYAGIKPSRNRLGALLLGNIATGCTLMANRNLYELARPVPTDALMFDHWMAQVAAGLGHIEFIDRPTLLYRQHAGNLIGASRVGSASFWQQIDRVLFSDKSLRVLSSYSCQAGTLLDRFGDRLDEDQCRQSATLAGIWQRPRLVRFVSLVMAGLFKPTLPANIGLFLLLLRKRMPVAKFERD